MNVLGPAEYAQHRDFILVAMAGVEFFAGISPTELEKACGFIQLVEFAAGEVVFEKDTAGDAFYLVYTGKAKAVSPGLLWSSTLGEIGPGNFFGEIALILNRPRTATVQCLEPMQCFRVDRAVYESLVEQDQALAIKIKEIAKSRYYNHH
jgi:CRP-like cAMP-binding protein